MAGLFDQWISQKPHRRMNVFGVILHCDTSKYSKDILTHVELMEIVIILLEGS